MSEQPIRVKLLADAADVLKTLPAMGKLMINSKSCLLYTSPSPRD